MAAVMSGSFLPCTLTRCLRSSYQTSSSVRHKSTPATLVGNEAHGGTAAGAATTEKDVLDLTFSDHEKAFRSKTNWELIRALLIFKLCGVKVIVKNNMKLMKFGQKVLGATIFEKVMKLTFYGHFVAGEDQIRIQPTLERLRSFGVKSILDYSVEEDLSEETATEREMQSLQSRAANQSSGPEADTQGSFSSSMSFRESDDPQLTQYKPQRKFADRRYAVFGARTYFYVNEAQCEKNMEIFINCIDAVSDATKGTGFAAIKMTALGRPQLLMQLSETIARARQYFHKVTGSSAPMMSADISSDVFKARFKKESIGPVDNEAVQNWLDHMTYDKKGLIHLFSWSGLIDTNMLLSDVFQVPNLDSGKMEPIITALTREEEEMFKNMMRRLHTIFQYARDRDVRVMVDAEQTYFQLAISRLTMELMKKYNTEKAIVFNTYQCYLKQTFTNLILDLEQCYRQNFYFGCKLVRGAYMDQERDRAKELRYEDPINDGFDATTEMYHQCLLEGLQKIQKNKEDGCPTKMSIMVASHNEDTVRFTLRNMKQYGVEAEDRVICFGQLLGMCDHISLPLGQSGFSVYKYVPYGPVNEVLPYLSRRAQENSSFLAKLEKECTMLKKEFFRRMRSGQFTYTPQGKYVALGAKLP
uniref:Proline dehydrogenase n=1 Tax=Hirondellea gigas TaxID=1518452 RepID=A0A2P2HY78_9CRUS